MAIRTVVVVVVWFSLCVDVLRTLLGWFFGGGTVSQMCVDGVR